MNIVFCTTCKGRAKHIKKTLPQNLKHNQNSTFVLLNYNSQDDLVSYLQSNHQQDINSGRLVIYTHYEPGPFHMAHAKNMAHRLGIVEDADLLVTLDADNFTGPDFDKYIYDEFKAAGESLYLPDRDTYLYAHVTKSNRVRHARGVAGRLVVRPQDFIKAGGYDEKYDTWRGEDMDLEARLRRMGYKGKAIDLIHLDAVRHNSHTRFKEYPHARMYENDEEVKIIQRSTDTVVNYGRFGLGIVYKNFGDEPLELRSLPTRIFGIGLHKTATSSLHSAFKLLGYDSFHWESNKKAGKIWEEMSTQRRSNTLEHYYALCDMPIPLFYKELDSTYPNSRFILTVRDESKWLKSVERLWDPKYNPTWDWDVQPFTHRIHRSFYGRIDFHAETFLNRYRQHNAEVRAYFKNSDRLLVMDMDDEAGWQELCQFLDRPTPNIPYPTEYKTKEISR
jgi:hypothetical protein